MRSMAAPTSWPMRIASPVLVSAPRLAWGCSASDWNFHRMSMLWSNPPAANTTPRCAVTAKCRPLCSTTAPVTRPSSVVNRVNVVSVQMGMPARNTPENNAAASACPPAT